MRDNYLRTQEYSKLVIDNNKWGYEGTIGIEKNGVHKIVGLK